MIGKTTVGEQPAEQGQSLKAVLILAVAALSFLMAVLGYWIGVRQFPRPAAGSAEVGFARDMVMHHAQAVDMATLIRDRSEDPEVRQLALDILLTQQAQIGQMQGWLNAWGYPLARVGPAMEWMGMPIEGLMPGMASPEEMNRLRSLEGVEAEILFLQLMIDHHRSGVVMGEEALVRADQLQVRDLAQAVVSAQVYEIDVMQTMLAQKGASPEATDEPPHEMPLP